MKGRFPGIATILAIVAGINLFVLLGAEKIILRQFEALEEREVHQHVRRVVNALEADTHNLERLTLDWAYWDDSYHFVETLDDDYIVANLVDTTYKQQKLDLILFFDRNTSLAFGQRYDRSMGEFLPLPDALITDFQAHIVHRAQTASVSGMARLGGDLYQLAAVPILRSDGSGPARGVLVMARRFGPEMAQMLGSRTRLPVQALEVKTPPRPEDSPENIPSVALRRQDADRMTASVLIRDLSGRPVLRLNLPLTRELMSQGRQSVRYFQAFVLVFSLLGALAFWQVQQKLAASRRKLVRGERLYRQLVEQSEDVYVLLGGDGTILDFNGRAVQILGYEPDELKRLSWDAVEIPPSGTSLLETVRREGHCAVEAGLRSKDGHSIPVDISLAIHPVEGEELVLAIARDIRQRKMAEVQLKESREEFRYLARQFEAVCNSLPDALLLLDRNLKILWANDGAEKIFGAVHGSPSRPTCHELLFSYASPCDECLALACLEDGRLRSVRRSLNDRTFDIKVFPVADGDNSYRRLILMAEDVTEKLKLEEDLRRTDQLAVIGELAAGVAHEVNNPINGIINYAQILARDSMDDANRIDIAERIQREGERIAAITRRLLSFARKNSEAEETIDLRHVINESVELMRPGLRKECIVLVTNFPDAPVWIKGVAPQLEQVFLNLLNLIP